MSRGSVCSVGVHVCYERPTRVPRRAHIHTLMLDPESPVEESRPLLDEEDEEGATPSHRFDLEEEEEATPSNRLASGKDPTPLPWLQFSTVVLVDLCAALSVSSMLPYITEVRLFYRLRMTFTLLSSLLADWISLEGTKKRSDTM